MKIKISILLISIIVLASCSHGVPPSEYVKYVENPGNGLKVKEAVNGVWYTLQYQPVEYCVMMEKRSFNVPSDVFKEEYSRFKGLEHYSLSIDKADMDSLVNRLGDTSKYKKGITEYFDFKIQKDIKLIEGKDTIPCSICQCDANTGISQYYTFSLGFSNKRNDKESDLQADRVIQFQNKILGTGIVNMMVTGKNMKNIPSLKTM